MNNIDIKLLSLFLVLMKERNVSRAAENLHLSQPTMSHNLAKLRSLFDDPILLRSRTEMIPTKRALELKPLIEALISNYQEIIQNSNEFDPSNSTRNFVLTAPEYAEQMLMPLILRRIRAVAPDIRIAVRVPDPEKANELLETGEVDLRIAWLLKPTKSLRSFHLFQDKIIYVADIKHPIIKGALTIQDFLKLPHARIQGLGTAATNLVIDEAVARQKKSLSVIFQLQNFMTVISALDSTDMIAAVPYKLAKKLTEKYTLQILEPPIRLPKMSYAAYWHEHNQRDAGHKWLRQIILQSAQDLRNTV